MMIGRNNLGKGDYNTYWKVSKGFSAFMRVAHVDNLNKDRWPTPAFKEFKLKAGDQIHDLHGGVFAVLKSGVAHKIRLKMGQVEEVYPEKNLKQITQNEATKPAAYHNGEFNNLLNFAQLNEQGLFLDN